MKVPYIYKKSATLMMAGLVATACLGCGQNKKEIASESFSTETEEENKTEMNLEDYVDSGVDFPTSLEKMIFPLEALALEYYSQGVSYYTDGEDTDAFWFPMAVLSSTMAEDGTITPDYQEEYYYYSKEDIDVFAATLYEAYAQGSFNLPEVKENSSYACYDDESKRYGLLAGNVGDLSIFITGCEEVEGGYEVEFQLKNIESGTVINEFDSVIHTTNSLDKTNLFGNTVAEFYVVDEADDSEEVTEEAVNGPTVDGDYDVVGGKEIVDDGDGEDYNKNYRYEEELTDQAMVSQEQALDLAKAYMGEDITYTYKQLITIGDYDYYDFSVEGKDLKSTDVLVCTNGVDVVSGVHNEDGSWSFDQ